jgi:hypothetical protein
MDEISINIAIEGIGYGSIECHLLDHDNALDDELGHGELYPSFPRSAEALNSVTRALALSRPQRAFFLSRARQ